MGLKVNQLRIGLGGTDQCGAASAQKRTQLTRSPVKPITASRQRQQSTMFRRSSTVVLASASCKSRCATRPARRLRGRLSLAAPIVLIGLLFIFLQREAARRTDSPTVELRQYRTHSVFGNAREFRIAIAGGNDDSALLNVDQARPDLAAAATAVATASGTAAEADHTDTEDSGAVTPGSERFILLDTNKEQFVYSAHYDDRSSVVHIVGFKHRFATTSSRPLWCRYDNGRGEDATLHRMEVHSNVSVFYPRPGLLYNTFVWRCAVNTGATRRPPLSVELVGGSGETALAMLHVQYTRPPQPWRREAQLQFGVCVKPMVTYNNLHQLVEFVEVHRLFGVSKFILYDYSHSPVIDAALSYYVAKGLVNIHRWPLPVPLEAVHADGQKSMNHHCLMTYMNIMKYIAFLDFDEILVPIAPARSWSDVITAIKLSPGSKATDGAYVFRSSIFPSEIANYSGLDCKSAKQLCKMATLVNRVRSDFYPVGSWSKPLVETRKTDLVDVHVVRRMMPKYTTLDVNPSVAFIHHYRAEVQTSNELADVGVEQFREDIIREVGAMLSKFSPSAANAA